MTKENTVKIVLANVEYTVTAQHNPVYSSIIEYTATSSENGAQFKIFNSKGAFWNGYISKNSVTIKDPVYVGSLIKDTFMGVENNVTKNDRKLRRIKSLLHQSKQAYRTLQKTYEEQKKRSFADGVDHNATTTYTKLYTRLHTLRDVLRIMQDSSKNTVDSIKNEIDELSNLIYNPRVLKVDDEEYVIKLEKVNKIL